MGHLKGAVTQGKLDEQRGVVQNEKRQYDNGPTASPRSSLQGLFPCGHPYSWTVIGSMEDCRRQAGRRASVVRHLLRPEQRVIAIAGDIDAKRRWPRSSSSSGTSRRAAHRRHQAWVAKRFGEQRQKSRTACRKPGS